MTKNLLVSFMIAALGGYIASLLHIPLPWTLGALFTSILWNLSSSRYEIFTHGRKTGQFIIGISLGLYFTKDIVALIGREWFLLSLGVICCLLVSLVTILSISKKRLSFATIYFTYLPGGASEMVNLSKKFGADQAFVAIGHTVRIILLVFSVPLLASIWVDVERVSQQAVVATNIQVTGLIASLIGSIIFITIWRKLKQANPWMIGALIGTAIPTYFMDLTMKVPVPLLAFAQVLLAMALADPITRTTLQHSLKYLKGMLLTSALGIAALIFSAYIISALFHLDFLTIGLGMMPGGISEMGLTAKQLNLNVAIVTTMQTMRLLIVMLVAKPIFIWIQQWRKSDNI